MGYGHKLMKHVDKMISRLIIDKPMTTDLISYYKHFGFKVTKNTITHIIMEKN